jgi:hypothetical protein
MDPERWRLGESNQARKPWKRWGPYLSERQWGTVREDYSGDGAAYGAQWKTTHDSGSDIPAVLPITNGRVFGVGPDIDMPVFAKGPNVGLVSFRYLWLVGPKTALGGQTLTASFTFARMMGPRR